MIKTELLSKLKKTIKGIPTKDLEKIMTDFLNQLPYPLLDYYIEKLIIKIEEYKKTKKETN